MQSAMTRRVCEHRSNTGGFMQQCTSCFEGLNIRTFGCTACCLIVYSWRATKNMKSD